MGFDMHGKTVGVVGTGKIGQCVVEILRASAAACWLSISFPNRS